MTLSPPLAAIYNQGPATVYGSLYASILRQIAIYAPSSAFQKDAQAFEKMRRDLAISKAMNQRKLLAAGSSFTVEAASSDARDVLLAGLVEAMLRRVRNFGHARYNLVEAILRGAAWAAPTTRLERRSLAGTPPLAWHMVDELRDVAVQRTRQVREQGLDAWTWQVYDVAPTGGLQWVNVPATWILHQHEPREEGMGFGSALADELYETWWVKTTCFVDAGRYAHLWCNGVIEAQIDSQGNSEGATPSATTRASDMLDTLVKLREAGVLLHDARDKVSMVAPPTGGSQIAIDLLSYCDQAMVSRILGSSLPSGEGGDKGSLARAEVEADTTIQLIAHDREALGETIKTQLCNRWLNWNASNLAKLGLAGREIGDVHLTDEEQQDHEAEARRLEVARNLGLPIKLEEAYSKLGLSAPTANDRVLTPPPAPVASPFGASPGL